ncbi:MAG: lipase family protein [Gemmataceae bacterium]|nr:lipase family protein [Gemmataceae bacterium]
MPWIDPDDAVAVSVRQVARLVQAACETDQRAQTALVRSQFRHGIRLPADWGFVVGNAREVVAAFRGSRDVLDWVCNLITDLTPGYGGRVHGGFAAMAEGLGGALVEAIEELRTDRQQLVLAGHSQGGALATLLGWRLNAAGIRPAAVVTFGAPKVGDAAFARRFPLPVFRVETPLDPVPLLPLSDEYRPTGRRLIACSNGMLYECDGSWLDGLVAVGTVGTSRRIEDLVANHYMETYVRYLEAGR